MLITGESGTGKELVAKAIHFNSDRKKKPFVTVNMAAIPKDLIESELFGHEKGSFTSAIKQRIGKFEQANGGTLFLDEIGDMSLPLQAKILRVLQEKTYERVGEARTRCSDVRILTATNRNLEQSVEKREFRQDLFFRLNVVPILVPALREHKEDVLFLAELLEERPDDVLRVLALDVRPDRQKVEAPAARYLPAAHRPG